MYTVESFVKYARNGKSEVSDLFNILILLI